MPTKKNNTRKQDRRSMSAVPASATSTASPGRLLPLLAALLLAGPASAEGEASPFYLGASLGLSHVSNVYRLPTGSQPNSDDVSTLSLLAGLDKPLGRQRLYADAALRRNTYRQERGLDNNAYSLSAGLDWAALDKLGGRLALRSNRNLAQYNLSTEVEPTTQKNIERSDQLDLSARYGLAGKLSLEGGLAHQRRSYSAPSYRLLEFRQNSASLGLGWRASGALRWGLIGRHTEGSGYARLFIFVLPNDYQREDLELSGEWIASAASTLNARLGISRIDNSNSGVDNYTGLTGRMTWQWQPSGKLKLSTTLARDTVQENYLAGASSIGAGVNRVTNSAQLAASYALGAKLQLDAGINLSRLDRSEASIATERNLGLSLGLRWQPTRNSQLGCQLSRDKRASALATLNYSASSYGCYGQLLLR